MEPKRIGRKDVRESEDRTKRKICECKDLDATGPCINMSETQETMRELSVYSVNISSGQRATLYFIAIIHGAANSFDFLDSSYLSQRGQP